MMNIRVRRSIVFGVVALSLSSAVSSGIAQIVLPKPRPYQGGVSTDRQLRIYSSPEGIHADLDHLLGIVVQVWWAMDQEAPNIDNAFAQWDRMKQRPTRMVAAYAPCIELYRQMYEQLKVAGVDYKAAQAARNARDDNEFERLTKKAGQETKRAEDLRIQSLECGNSAQAEIAREIRERGQQPRPAPGRSPWDPIPPAYGQQPPSNNKPPLQGYGKVNAPVDPGASNSANPPTDPGTSYYPVPGYRRNPNGTYSGGGTTNTYRGGIRNQNNQRDTSTTLAWQNWHKVVDGLIYNECSRKVNAASNKPNAIFVCTVSYTVTSDQRIVNVRVSNPSPSSNYNNLVTGAVSSLDGDPRLAFPRGSNRQSVDKAYTSTYDPFGKSGLKYNPKELKDKEWIKRHRAN